MQQLKSNTTLQSGKYRIEKTLGQGSFGITYLAIHTTLDKKVAIKEFFMKELNSRGDDGSITGMSDGSLSANYGQKFKKEAVNLSRLEHPNIVRVTDSFEENGTYYYVMDFIEGENLNDYLKHNSLSQDEAISIIKDVAIALMYMHEEKHMLHLDLKPANIMRRSSDGHIFLIDFGLSKHYSNDGQPETSTTIGLGTPGYAPVEQSNQNKSGEFRPTIDVYALGATLFKLLTRETPPPASDIINDDELVGNKLRDNGISTSMINLVVNAMMPGVKKRPQTVQAFLDILTSDANACCAPKGNAVSTNKEETIITNATTVNDEATVVISSNHLGSQPVFYNNGELNVNGSIYKMIPIVGGTFTMDVTMVTVSDYSIGQTEVTQALWKAVMGNNPSHFKGDNRPVECVSWNECMDFLAKLNNLTGKKFRLPTEAEWEFAARGGNNSKNTIYSGSSNVADVAWYYHNSEDETHPVALKQANELGLYDMSGNVKEWCNDWYAIYNSSPQTNPIGPNNGSYRIVRGGCFNSVAGFCNLSSRDQYPPVARYIGLGFRLCLSE